MSRRPPGADHDGGLVQPDAGAVSKHRLGGSGAARTVTVTPAATQSARPRYRDGQRRVLTASDTFVLTANRAGHYLLRKVRRHWLREQRLDQPGTPNLIRHDRLRGPITDTTGTRESAGLQLRHELFTYFQIRWNTLRNTGPTSLDDRLGRRAAASLADGTRPGIHGAAAATGTTVIAAEHDIPCVGGTDAGHRQTAR